MQFFGNKILEIRLSEEILHYIEALVHRLHILQREKQPAFQQTRTHRTDGMVNYIQQTCAPIIHTAHKLQAANRKLIHAYIAVFFNTRQGSNVPYLVMLSHSTPGTGVSIRLTS